MAKNFQEQLAAARLEAMKARGPVKVKTTLTIRVGRLTMRLWAIHNAK